MLGKKVRYTHYIFNGLGAQRSHTTKTGIIIGEISTSYQIRSENGEVYWRLKDNVEFI